MKKVTVNLPEIVTKAKAAGRGVVYAKDMWEMSAVFKALEAEGFYCPTPKWSPTNLGWRWVVFYSRPEEVIVTNPQTFL